MSYCTLSDLQSQLDDADLINLTDDLGAGSIDETVINRYIADAEAEIDSYCASRYSLPFTTVPTILRKLCIDITLYNLFGRRRGASEDRVRRYNNAIEFLKMVARGEISLGGATTIPSEDTDQGPASTTDIADRIFSMGRTSDSTIGTLDNY